MSGLSINTGSTNNTIINPLVIPKLKFEGKFNYPVMTLGSNQWDGGLYSINGGRSWDAPDTLEYNPEYTFIIGNGLSSNMNMSPNLTDVCIWSWEQGGGAGDCIRHLSHDAGRNWTSTAFINAKHEYTHWNYDTNNIYLGGWAGGNKKSTDAGDNFTTITMSGGQQAVVFDSSNNENYIYAGMANNESIQYSTNQGDSWTNVGVSTAGTGNARIVKCTADGQYVIAYYGSYSIEADFSDNYGVSYTNLPNSADAKVEIRRDGSSMMYTSNSTSRIYFSTNQGTSWTFITSPFGNNYSTSFRQDYVNNEIYVWCAGYSTIYRVNDTGDDVELVKTLDYNVNRFETSLYGRGYVYRADAPVEGNIYFSRNLQTWELIREGNATNIGVYLSIF